MKKKILIHLGISVLYFWVIMLMSWNKSGGDIFAVFFIFVFLLIHLLVVFIKMIRHKNQRHYYSLIGIACGLVLQVLSFHLLNEYRAYNHEAAGGDRVILD